MSTTVLVQFVPFLAQSGVQSGAHITVAFIRTTRQNYQQAVLLINNILKKYYKLLGSTNKYVIVGNGPLNPQNPGNSYLVKSYSPASNIGLNDIRQQIFNDLLAEQMNGLFTIDTTRYHGLPPQHIDVRNVNQQFKNDLMMKTEIGVTYSLQCK